MEGSLKDQGSFGFADTVGSFHTRIGHCVARSRELEVGDWRR